MSSRYSQRPLVRLSVTVYEIKRIYLADRVALTHSPNMPLRFILSVFRRGRGAINFCVVETLSAHTFLCYRVLGVLIKSVMFTRRHRINIVLTTQVYICRDNK